MFKENKYTTIYNKIITVAKNRLLEGYTESHHIIPKCLGGTDEKNNLVELTAREHFIAHLLLTKMNDSNKLKFALYMMQVVNEYQKRYVIKSSKIYELVKRLNSDAAILRNKNRIYRTGYVTAISPDGKIKRFDNVESIPDGWKRSSGTSGKSINKGNIYIFNDTTKEVKCISNKDQIEEGWSFGNPNATLASAKNNIKNSSYYFDPITHEEGRFHTPPAGWIKGRSVRWYNNGKINKQFKLSETVSDEWSPGLSYKLKNIRKNK